MGDRPDIEADAHGTDRSAFLRDVVLRRLARLRAELEIGAWVKTPLTAAERALGEIADWGPPEDWSDWPEAAD